MPERRYTRVDRVNELVREVVADELTRIDDERLQLVTVTGARVARDLAHAVVWFDCLGDPEAVAAALEGRRARLQAAVARQVRLKRTPELSFRSDPAIAAGSRVEEILRTLRVGPDEGRPPAAEDGSP